MDADALRVWIMRAIYVALALAILFFALLPLQPLPRSWAGPDILVALTFAWALRRPDFVPALLIAAVMLTADFVLQRPPGLWAALTVLMAENLKTRQRRARETSLALEWLSVSMALAAMTALYQIARIVVILPPAGWTLMLSQLVATALAYPLVAGLSIVLFGRGRTRHGESDRMGHSL